MTGEAVKVETVGDYIDWLKHVNDNFEKLDLGFIPDELLNTEVTGKNKEKILNELNGILSEQGGNSREAQFISDAISIIKQ